MWMERGTIETEKFEKRIVKNHERWDETAALHLYFANEDEEFRSAFSGLSHEEALVPKGLAASRGCTWTRSL